MRDSTWNLFLRTGLPQVYTFAKAREQRRVQTDGENQKRERKSHERP